MSVCIQDTATNQYFQGPFTWVQDGVAAYNFVNTLDAIDLCSRLNRKARVLLRFDDTRDEVCLFEAQS